VNNVAFINTFYYPEEHERKRLEKIQEEHSMVQAELSYALREVFGYERWIRKEIFHQKFRERSISIVKVDTNN
jgi:hypothetical protein